VSVLDRWKNHPFAVDAHFDFSLVLTYALPATTLAPLVPPMLALDTFDDHGTHDAVGFVAVAMVQTRGLRPARLPRLFGRDFFLVGTRVFVRFTTREGRTLRGLYILRSQTDSRAMLRLGDVFTRYRYEPLDVDVHRTPAQIAVRSGDFTVVVDTRPRSADVAAATAPGDHGDPSDDGAPGDDGDDAPALPAGSPFSTWKDARRFAGPMPHTFSVLDPGHVLVVEGVRQHWRPRPVRVVEARVPFFAERALDAPVLASAFLVEDVPYHWNAGRREPCPIR
jgi:hypothetical protein